MVCRSVCLTRVRLVSRQVVGDCKSVSCLIWVEQQGMMGRGSGGDMSGWGGNGDELGLAMLEDILYRLA